MLKDKDVLKDKNIGVLIIWTDNDQSIYII